MAETVLIEHGRSIHSGGPHLLVLAVAAGYALKKVVHYPLISEAYR